MGKLQLKKDVIVKLDNEDLAEVKGGNASSDTITMMPTTLQTDLCTVMNTHIPEVSKD